MDTSSDSSPAFHSFSRLPPELREQIWRDALPSDNPPSLYFYRKWCLSPGPLAEDAGSESDDIAHNSRHEIHRNFQLDAPPLFFVNHEARGTAVRWMLDHQIINWHSGGGKEAIFVRDFDPALDIVCITSNKWLEFLTELFDRYFVPDILARHHTTHSMDIRHLAVCHTLLSRDLSTIPGIYYILNQIDVLIVVLNMPVASQGGDTQPHNSWELKTVQGWGLHWNPESHLFESENNQPGGDQKLQHAFEKAVIGLRGTLNSIGQSVSRLEIRAAYISQ